MGSRKRIFLVLFTIILCIACDQITKEIARSRLSGTRPMTFAGGMMKLDYSVNKSAEFVFE